MRGATMPAMVIAGAATSAWSLIASAYGATSASGWNAPITNWSTWPTTAMSSETTKIAQPVVARPSRSVACSSRGADRHVRRRGTARREQQHPREHRHRERRRTRSRAACPRRRRRSRARRQHERELGDRLQHGHEQQQADAAQRRQRAEVEGDEALATTSSASAGSRLAERCRRRARATATREDQQRGDRDDREAHQRDRDDERGSRRAPARRSARATLVMPRSSAITSTTLMPNDDRVGAVLGRARARRDDERGDARARHRERRARATLPPSRAIEPEPARLLQLVLDDLAHRAASARAIRKIAAS